MKLFNVDVDLFVCMIGFVWSLFIVNEVSFVWRKEGKFGLLILDFEVGEFVVFVLD